MFGLSDDEVEVMEVDPEGSKTPNNTHSATRYLSFERTIQIEDEADNIMTHHRSVVDQQEFERKAYIERMTLIDEKEVLENKLDESVAKCMALEEKIKSLMSEVDEVRNENLSIHEINRDLLSQVKSRDVEIMNLKKNVKKGTIDEYMKPLSKPAQTQVDASQLRPSDNERTEVAFLRRKFEEVSMDNMNIEQKYMDKADECERKEREVKDLENRVSKSMEVNEKMQEALLWIRERPLGARGARNG